MSTEDLKGQIEKLEKELKALETLQQDKLEAVRRSTLFENNLDQLIIQGNPLALEYSRATANVASKKAELDAKKKESNPGTTTQQTTGLSVTPSSPSTTSTTTASAIGKPNKLAPYFPGFTTDDKGNSTPKMGALCHQQRPAAVPVCAITDLENKIIMSNTNKAGDWVVLKARTNINNYWDASTAFFQCTVAATDTTADIPPSPGGIARHMLVRSSFDKGVKYSDEAQLGSTLAIRYGKDKADAVKTAILNPQNYTTYDTQGSQSRKVKGISIDKIDAAFRNLLPDISKAKTPTGEVDEKKKQVTDDALRQLLDSLKVTNQIQSEPRGIVTEEDLQAALNDPNSKLAQFFAAASSIENSEELEAGLTDGEKEAKAAATQDEIEEFPLDILDEVCIFFGYLDTMRPVTQQDIAENRLLRRGVWVIDTVTKSGGASAGIVWTVQCRDRLKYLMDTLGSFNTAANNDLLIGDILAQKPGDKAEGASPPPAKSENAAKNGAAPAAEPTTLKNSRSLAILYIARTGIGDLGDFNVGGRFIEKGFILDISDYAMATSSEEPGTGASEADKGDSSSVAPP
jgi:hypothetical protein